MEIYDLFMLGIVVVAALLGAMKGLAWQIASAAAFVGSYIVALTFYPQLAVHIDAEEPWNKYLAMFASIWEHPSWSGSSLRLFGE